MADMEFNVAVSANTAALIKMATALEAVAKKLDTLDRKRANPKVDVDTKKAERDIGAFATRMKSQLAAAVKSLPKIEITGDSGDFEKKMARIRSEMARFSGKTVGVNITADKAVAQLERLRVRLRNLEAQAPTIQVQSDIATARAELTALDRAIQRDRKLTMDVKEPAREVGALAELIERQLTRAIKSIPDINVNAKTGDAQRKLAELTAQMKALQGKTIGTDIDAGGALAQISSIAAALRALQGSTDVRVAADAGQALAELEKVDREVKKRRQVEIDTKPAKVELGAFAESIERELGQAIRAIPPIKIDADSSEAQRELLAVRRAMETLRDLRIDVDIDANQAFARVEQLRARLLQLAENSNLRIAADARAAISALDNFDRNVVNRERKVKIDADTSTAEVSMGSFADRVQRQLSNAIKALPEVELTANSSRAMSEVNRLRNAMQALSDKRIGVDIDGASAMAEMSRISTELRLLTTLSPDIQIRADAAMARRELDDIQRRAQRLNSTRLNINGAGLTSTLSRLGLGFISALNAAAQFSRTLGTLALPASLSAGIGTLAAIGAAAASAAQSLLLIPAAATAAGAAVGALSLGVSGLGDVFKAVQQADEAAATSASSGASTRAAAAERIRSAQESLEDAVRNADRTSVQGAERVADARQALADAQVNAAERIQEAERNLSDAVENGARRVSDAQQGLANAIASSARSIRDAQQGVADAVENSARRIRDAQQRLSDAVENSARRIADAEESLSDAVENSASRIASARQAVSDAIENGARRVENAERSLERSQVSAQRAQEDLTQARKDAAEQLEDLQLALSGAALDEEAALIRLEKARRDLAREPAAPGSLQWRETELAVRQAEQALKEVRERYADIQEESTEATQKGVEGSDRVRDAQENLANANQNVADAERDLARARTDSARDVAEAQQRLVEAQQEGAEAIADAQQRLIDAQTRGARDVADAQRSLTDAQRQGARDIADAQQRLADAQVDGARRVSEAQQNLADAQRDAARDIADAQRDLQRAQIDGAREVQDAQTALARAQRDAAQANEDAARTVARAQRDLAEALRATGGEGAAAADKVRAAMDKLAPSAREVVNAILALKPAWDNLRLDVQQTMFEGIATVVTRLAQNYLPPLREMLVSIAGGFNQAMKDVGGFLNEASTVTDLTEAFRNSSEAVNILTGSSEDLARIWVDLTAVGSEFLPGLAQGFANVVTSVQRFVAEARETGQLEVWIAEGIVALEQLARITVDVGGVIASVFRASRDSGADFLGTVELVTDRLNSFFRSADGQEALIHLFQSLRESTKALLPGLEALVRNIGEGMRGAHPAVVAMADAFSEILIAIAPAIPAIADFAGFAIPMFAQIVEWVAKFAQLLGPVVPVLLTMVAAWKTFSLIGSAFLGPLGAGVANAAARVSIFAENMAAATGNSGRFAAASDRVATAGIRVQSAMDKAAAALPFVGLALVGIGSILDSVKSKAEEYAGKVVSGSMTLQEAYNAERNQIEKNEGAWLGLVSAEEADALARQRVNEQIDKALALLPRHEQAQKRANIFHAEYNRLVSEGKGGTEEAAVALSQYQSWTARAEVEQHKFTEEIKTTNQRIKDQNDLMFAAQNAQFAWEDSLDAITEAQERLNEVMKDPEASPTDRARAQRDLSKSYFDSAEAAGRLAEEEMKGLDPARAAEAGQRARMQALMSFAHAATGPAKQAILETIAGMDAEAVSALSAENATSGLKTAIVELPDGRKIEVLVDPKQAHAGLDGVQKALKQVPNATQVTVDALTDVAIDDLRSLGFEVTVLPNGQVQIDVHDEEGRRKLDAFIVFSQALKATPQVDANTIPAHERSSEWLNRTNTLLGMATADADIAPGTQRAEELRKRIDAIKAFMEANADIQPGTDQARRLQDMVNGLVGVMTQDGNNKPGTAQGDALWDYVNNRLKPVMKLFGDNDPGLRKAGELDSWARSRRPIMPIGGDNRPAHTSINAADRYAAGRRPSMWIGGNWSGVVRAVQDAIRWVGQQFANINIGGLGYDGMLALPMKKGGLIQPMAEGGLPSEFQGHRLSPMAVGQAQLVQPNAWRIVGDRPDVPEAYIPWKKTDWTVQLLRMTAAALDHQIMPIDRSGRSAVPMHMGGFAGSISRMAFNVASQAATAGTSGSNVDMAQMIRIALKEGLAEAMKQARVIENHNEFNVADVLEAADKFARRMRTNALMGALDA